MTYPAFFVTQVDLEIGLEGAYTVDSGGPTMWGITETDARAYGYAGAMQDLPRATAVDIYYQKYFVGTQLDKLSLIDPSIAAKLLDIAINTGVGELKFLQRALNVMNYLNATKVLFPSLELDGELGPVTRDALTAFIARRGDDGRKVLLGMIVAQQAVYYIECAEAKPGEKEYEWGWQVNRAIGTSFTFA